MVKYRRRGGTISYRFKPQSRSNSNIEDEIISNSSSIISHRFQPSERHKSIKENSITNNKINRIAFRPVTVRNNKRNRRNRRYTHKRR